MTKTSLGLTTKSTPSRHAFMNGPRPFPLTLPASTRHPLTFCPQWVDPLIAVFPPIPTLLCCEMSLQHYCLPPAPLPRGTILNPMAHRHPTIFLSPDVPIHSVEIHLPKVLSESNESARGTDGAEALQATWLPYSTSLMSSWASRSWRCVCHLQCKSELGLIATLS